MKKIFLNSKLNKFFLLLFSFIILISFWFFRFSFTYKPDIQVKKIAFIVHTETLGGKGVLQFYKEMKKVGHDVKIIAIPSFYNKKLLSSINLEYLKNFSPSDVVYPCGQTPPYTRCQSLKGFNFDYLFISNPYDTFKDSPLDPYYLVSSLKKFSKKIMMVVYGPHLFHQDNINDLNLQNILDVIFVDSESTKKIYVERYKFPSHRVVISGYQPYKNIRDEKEDKRSETKKLTLLWLPRWNLSFENRALFEGGSTFLNYHYFFYNYAKNNPDIILIIRPHLLLYTYSVEGGFISQADLDSIFQRFKSLPNVIISDHDDILLDRDIFSSDIVISDGTSALGEVIVADKPIIYLSNGWDNEFNSNDLSLEFKKHIFIANQPRNIMELIQYIRHHNYKVYSSSSKDKRDEFKKLLDPVENPAEYIAQYLLR